MESTEPASEDSSTQTYSLCARMPLSSSASKLCRPCATSAFTVKSLSTTVHTSFAQHQRSHRRGTLSSITPVRPAAIFGWLIGLSAQCSERRLPTHTSRRWLVPMRDQVRTMSQHNTHGSARVFYQLEMRQGEQMASKQQYQHYERHSSRIAMHSVVNSAYQ